MFDFTWSEHTSGNIWCCTILYALFLILFFNRYVNHATVQSRKGNIALLFSALLLIITVCIDTDWFHYREMVLGYDLSAGAHNYGEPIYWWIIKFVNRNYLLFRLIVWGGAFVIAARAFKRFGVNVNTAVFFVVAVFLIKFNYARATLGMACYFLGLSFLIVPGKRSRLINVFFAALFMFGAYEFHHSMLLLIFLTPIVLVPVDKLYFAIALLLILPFLASMLNANLILIDRLENEYISTKMANYLEREGGASNIFGIIQNVIGYGAFAIPLLLDSMLVYRNRKQISLPMLKLYRIVIGVTILALSFMLMNLDSALFVYRILYMMFIPLTIVTVYLYEHQFMSKQYYRFVVLWGIAAISYIILHLVYVYIL